MKKITFVIAILSMASLCSACHKNTAAIEAARFAQAKPSTTGAKCPDIEPYIEEHNEFHGSDTQMLYWSKLALQSLYARYDKLCKKIETDFKDDKAFIKAFKEDRTMFEKRRDAREALVRPHSGNFGLMPEFDKWGYDYSSTVEQIEKTKRNLLEYCEYNSDLLKDKSVCTEEKINKMFEEIKLKTPKPLITTPYD